MAQRTWTRRAGRRQIAAGAVAAALAIGLLAGCTASASGSSAAMPASAASAGVAFQSAAGRSSTDQTTSKLATADRSITTTGRLQLSAKDPIGIATAITGLVEASGGRVENVHENPDTHASAQLTARIPSNAFDTTLAAIKKTGTVADVSITATDVTSRVTDYTVRTSTLRTSIDRLQRLLDRATNTKDLVDIETTLEDRETSLEQLLADQKGLTDQIAFSTLTISVVEPAAIKKAAPSNFATGFLAGAAALGTTIGALVVGLGVALPWLVVLGILAAIVVVIRRTLRSRRTPPIVDETV